jgi:hypothetical protein
MPGSRLNLVAAGWAAAAALVLGLTTGRRAMGLELGSLAVVLGSALILTVALAHAIRGWLERRWAALAPLALLLAAIPGTHGVRLVDTALSDRRFQPHLAELETTVDRLAVPPGETIRLSPEDLPESVKVCCYRAFARRDGDERAWAVFQVRREVAYLYDPSGQAMRGKLSRGWSRQDPVAPNWYRLAR